jgi:hypothetical protein
MEMVNINCNIGIFFGGTTKKYSLYFETDSKGSILSLMLLNMEVIQIKHPVFRSEEFVSLKGLLLLQVIHSGNRNPYLDNEVPKFDVWNGTRMTQPQISTILHFFPLPFLLCDTHFFFKHGTQPKILRRGTTTNYTLMFRYLGLRYNVVGPTTPITLRTVRVSWYQRF